MLLDKATFNNLEIKKSSRDNNDRYYFTVFNNKLYNYIYGRKIFIKCLEKPLISKDEINRRLDCVQEIYDGYNLQSELKEIIIINK